MKNCKTREEYLVYYKIASNKYKNTPDIQYYHNKKTLNVIDMYIYYRLITSSCKLGGDWIFDMVETQDSNISVNDILGFTDFDFPPYRFDDFKNYLLNNNI